MTTPPGDDEIAPLDPHASSAALMQARESLLDAARGLRRAWLGLTLLAAAPVVASAVMFAVSLFTRPEFVLLWSVLLTAASLNLIRFWPQDNDGRGHRLEEEETRRLRHALDPHAPAWIDTVNLVPEATVHMQGDRLSLGMPLLACLAEEDLRRLVSIANRAAGVAEEDTAVRRALSLADGRIGRPLVSWMRTYPRSSGAGARYRAALRDFRVERDQWSAAFRANAETSSRNDARSMRHQDIVIEAWELMRKEWIGPSLDRGCWHRAPFSSLQQFLFGAHSVGLVDEGLPARPQRGPLVDLVLAHEDAVGELLLGERRTNDLRTIGWDDHPNLVTIPTWRSIVGEALDVSRQLTGRTTPPTVAGVLSLIESTDLAAVAQHIAPNHGIDQQTVGWGIMSRWMGGYSTLLLTAVVGMAAIDSGRFTSQWRWPDGTTLLDLNGWILPLHRIADEVLWPKSGRSGSALEELETALGELGIDVTEALWLTRDVARVTTPERPTGSFVAFQGFGSRQVIVTDKALHAFGRPFSSGWRDHYASRMRGADELRTRMLRVWQGDETDQTAYIPESEVVSARFSLLTGGGRWRLVLQGAGSRFTLRGWGEGRVEEEILAGWLGDRLTTTWLHTKPAVRRLRNVVGRIGLGIGGLALVAAVVLAAVRPTDSPERLSLALVALGLGAFVVAVLPDVVLDIVWKVRGPALRPKPTVIVRRYARPPEAVQPVSEEPREGPRGSAMESITLDLGDLPSLADWPDDTGIDFSAFDDFEEIDLSDVDLDALGDLDLEDAPAWPDNVRELPRDA